MTSLASKWLFWQYGIQSFIDDIQLNYKIVNKYTLFHSTEVDWIDIESEINLLELNPNYEIMMAIYSAISKKLKSDTLQNDGFFKTTLITNDNQSMYFASVDIYMQQTLGWWFFKRVEPIVYTFKIYKLEFEEFEEDNETNLVVQYIERKINI